MPRPEDHTDEILISYHKEVQQFKGLYSEVHKQAALLWRKDTFTLANLQDLSATVSGQRIISEDTENLLGRLQQFEDGLEDLEHEDDQASKIIVKISEADERPDRDTYDMACGIVFRYDGSLDKLRKSSNFAKRLFVSAEAKQLRSELEAQKRKHEDRVNEITKRSDQSAWSNQELGKSYEDMKEANNLLRERNKTLEDLNDDLKSDLKHIRKDLEVAETKIEERGTQNTRDAQTISRCKYAYQGKKQALEIKEAELNDANNLILQLRTSESTLKQKNEDLERQLSASHLRYEALLESKSETIRSQEAVIHGQEEDIGELRRTVCSTQLELETEKETSRILLKARDDLEEHIADIRVDTERLSGRVDMHEGTRGSDKDLARIGANLRRVQSQAVQQGHRIDSLRSEIANTKAHCTSRLSECLDSILPQSCRGSRSSSKISAMLIGLEKWELSAQPCRPCWSFAIWKRMTEFEEELINRYAACESFEISALLYYFISEKQCDSMPIALLSILADRLSSCTDIACAMTLVMCCKEYIQRATPASDLRPWLTIIMYEVGRYTREAYPDLWAGQSHKFFCSELDRYMKQTETLFHCLYHFVKAPNHSLIGLARIFGQNLLDNTIPLVSRVDTQWVLMIDVSKPSVILLPKSSFVREMEDPLNGEVRYTFKDEKASRKLTWAYKKYGDDARWWRRCILDSMELSPESQSLLLMLQSGADLFVGMDRSDKTGRVPD